MKQMISKCLNCTLPDCTDCIGNAVKEKHDAANRKYCKTYYQRHKQECIERTKKNRMKKRIENKGYEMAIYI